MQAEIRAKFNAKNKVKRLVLPDHDYTYNLSLLEEAREFREVNGFAILNPRLPLHEQSLLTIDKEWRDDFYAYLRQLEFFEDRIQS